MRAAAKAHRKVKPVAEDVILLEPGLIVRSYGGGPNAAQFFRKLGVPVVQIGYANSIAEVKNTILQVAEDLSVKQKGESIVEDMDSRLRQFTRQSKVTVLYITPGGVTGGPDTLIDSMIKAAGFTNFQTEPGWRSLPLEKLAYNQPEALATAFYGDKANHQNLWSASRHPVVRTRLSKKSTIALNSATTACGGWFILDAVEKLASLNTEQAGSQ